VEPRLTAEIAVLRDAVTDGVTPHEAARRRARRRLGRSAS